MDLYTIQSYLRPHRFTELAAQGMTASTWQERHCHWLAGGTWTYSQPQPQIKTLVDLDGLKWSDIEITETGLRLGATCTLAKVLQHPWPPEWLAISALQAAIACLASFKVTEMATVGGNLCLALTVGTLAPVMVALDAHYEIWDLSGERRWVEAQAFQTGAQQTLLEPGQVLRQIHIPITGLTDPAQFYRFSPATVEPALTLVVGRKQKHSSACWLTLGGAVSFPQRLHFPDQPQPEQIRQALQSLPHWIEDYRGSARYRQHLTGVLAQRCLNQLFFSA